jgi:hypothetical protein
MVCPVILEKLYVMQSQAVWKESAASAHLGVLLGKQGEIFKFLAGFQ